MTQYVFGKLSLIKKILAEIEEEYGKDGPPEGRPPSVYELGGVRVVGPPKGAKGEPSETVTLEARDVGGASMPREIFARLATMLPREGETKGEAPATTNPPRSVDGPTTFTIEGVHMDVPLALRAQDATHAPVMPPVVRPRRAALAKLRGTIAAECGGTGKDVGVVIVDEGYSQAHLIAEGVASQSNFGGGFQLLNPTAQNSPMLVGHFADPYRRQVDGHGNMVARNVLALAPEATLFDAPVLPPRVTDLGGFASGATAVLHAIRIVIEHPNLFPLPKMKHWIVVCAWAVADRFADAAWRSGVGPSYVANRGHVLNGAAVALSESACVVFAAGNSGEHDPAPFAGAYDRGPHRSIWGANGLSEVTTVGATTLDGHAVTVGSQGPAPHALLSASAAALGDVNAKPETFAPSWFTQDDDASVLNTGTSAAAALHAGLLATRHST